MMVPRQLDLASKPVTKALIQVLMVLMRLGQERKS